MPLLISLNMIKKWIEIFKENIKLNDGIKIHNPSLEVFEFQNVKNYKYENLLSSHAPILVLLGRM